jgi:hypothetical protein
MARDKISVKGDNGARPEISMPQWNFERIVTSMRILAEFGIAHGMPAQVLLAGTGVREAELADPTCTVSGRQELRLMRNLVERLGAVPALGIEAGSWASRSPAARRCAAPWMSLNAFPS